MPNRIDPELRARAVRLVAEYRAEHPTETAAMSAVAKQLSVSRESMRRWMTQSEVDAGDRPGVTSDDALMQCINGLYKAECIRTQVFHQGPYRTIGDVEYATAGWVDWYNNRCLHSTIGMVPPAEHEHAYYAALNREPQPV